MGSRNLRATLPPVTRRRRSSPTSSKRVSAETTHRRGVSVERRVHSGCKQGRQLSDVVESVDAEDGFLDGGLPVCRDDVVSQLGVFVTDFRVRQVPVAGAARVYDLGGASGPVLEGQAHLGGELLVDREGVGGLFGVG